MNDELVSAQIAERLDLDRVCSHRGKAVLVSLARGLGVFERRHFGHQYRLTPVPVPGAVAVEGSAPEAPGVFCAPATAVGDGDEPGGVDGGRVATGVPVAAVDGVGDADWDEGGAEGDDADGGVVLVGGALWATGADGLTELEEGLGLA